MIVHSSTNDGWNDGLWLHHRGSVRIWTTSFISSCARAGSFDGPYLFPFKICLKQSSGHFEHGESVHHPDSSCYNNPIYFKVKSRGCENLLDPTYDVRITNNVLLAVPAVCGILS